MCRFTISTHHDIISYLICSVLFALSFLPPISFSAKEYMYANLVLALGKLDFDCRKIVGDFTPSNEFLAHFLRGNKR